MARKDKQTPEFAVDDDEVIASHPDRVRALRRAVNGEFAGLRDVVSELVTDVSETGAFVETDQPLAVGTRILLRFTVVLDEIEVVRASGMVVRVATGSDGGIRGMGIAFDALPADTAEILRRAAATRLSSD